MRGFVVAKPGRDMLGEKRGVGGGGIVVDTHDARATMENERRRPGVQQESSLYIILCAYLCLCPRTHIFKVQVGLRGTK